MDTKRCLDSKNGTGIKERRHVIKVTGRIPHTSHGVVKRLKSHIDRSGIDKNDIDFMCLCHIKSGLYFPGPGVLYNAILDIKTVGALDGEKSVFPDLYTPYLFADPIH